MFVTSKALVHEAIQITKAMKALVFYLNGATKVAACEKAGIPPSTYDLWVVEAGDIIAKYQEGFLEVQQNRLLEVAAAESFLITKLIDTVSGDKPVHPNTLLNVIEFLSSMRKEMEGKLGAVVQHTSADEFLNALTGPSRLPEKSMMHDPNLRGEDITFNITPRPDGSVDIIMPRPVQILDLNQPEEDNNS